jgi:hypothetical protein
MTIKQYVDEVMLRLRRYDVSLEIDIQTATLFVDRARREVQMSTVGLYPERYSGIVTPTGIAEDAAQSVTNRSTGQPIKLYKGFVPRDIIEPKIVVVLYGSGATESAYEARRVDKRELYNVMRHSWVRPTPITPVYAIEATSSEFSVNETRNSKNLIYIAGPPSITFNTRIFTTLALDFHDYLPDYENGTLSSVEDMETSWMFTEMVITHALVDCLQKIEAPAALASVKAEQQFYAQMVKEMYSMNTTQSQRLPSNEPII